MKFALSQLQRFCPATPSDPLELHRLLDDLGLEVKRVETLNVGGVEDTVYTLELLANRGDHYAYSGVARELAVRLNAPLQTPATQSLDQGEAPIPLTIETDKCLRYALAPFAVKVNHAKLGPDETKLLEAADLVTGHALIDVTNLVNCELGQPTHAFDADTIRGGITIRESREGEEAHPLFAEESIKLPAGTVVIADDEKVLAVAGVIGCEESKVTDTTKRMLLESAAFDPVAVRLAARKTRIATDSSARFERGCDPTLVPVASERIAHVLTQAGAAEPTGPLAMVGDWADAQHTVSLDFADLSAFFERDFDPAEVKRILEGYGFTAVDDTTFRVPPHRAWDVVEPEDLYEELARAVGYNELPEALPAIDAGVSASHEQDVEATVDGLLTAHGFYEVYTDGFYARNVREQLGLKDGDALWPHVEITNALDKDYALLKNNTLGPALQAMALNRRFQSPDVKLYEWTRTFHPAPPGSDNSASDSDGAPGVTERHVLWGVGYGAVRPGDWGGNNDAVDLFYLKGVIEELGKALHLPFTFAELSDDEPLAGALHPYRSLSVTLDGRRVGVVGEVHPVTIKAFNIKGATPSYFELETKALQHEPVREPMTELRAAPDVIRMLSFTMPASVSVKDVLPVLRNAGPEWFTGVSVADVFEKNDDRAVTFRVAFAGLPPRTADELNAACDAMVKAVTGAFGDRGVKLR